MDVQKLQRTPSEQEEYELQQAEARLRTIEMITRYRENKMKAELQNRASDLQQQEAKKQEKAIKVTLSRKSINAQPSPRTLALYQGYVSVAKEAKERAQREKELQEIKAKKKADDRIRYLAQQKKELNAFTMGESPSLNGIEVAPDVPELSDHIDLQDDHHYQQV